MDDLSRHRAQSRVNAVTALEAAVFDIMGKARKGLRTDPRVAVVGPSGLRDALHISVTMFATLATVAKVSDAQLRRIFELTREFEREAEGS